MDNGVETLEQMQARHRIEARDLQGRITSKKKNATKKTRKGVNDKCFEMERRLRDRQAEEARELDGGRNLIYGEGGGGGEALQGEDGDGDGNEQESAKGTGEATAAAEPPRPTPTSTHTHTPPCRKRNRQKERLARRAAEHDAAALAAEEEAANMTDYKAAEKKHMEAEFHKHGLDEHEIRPDGHCLFSAVADQLAHLSIALGGDDDGAPAYSMVRRKAAEYIHEHGDEYAAFLDESLDSYVAKIRDTAEWGGQLELLALSNVYGVDIHVVHDRQTEVIRPTATGHPRPATAPLWLAYYRHGYGLGEHYNSLRKRA